MVRINLDPVDVIVDRAVANFVDAFEEHVYPDGTTWYDRVNAVVDALRPYVVVPTEDDQP